VLLRQAIERAAFDPRNDRRSFNQMWFRTGTSCVGRPVQAQATDERLLNIIVGLEKLATIYEDERQRKFTAL
jgi:hypothetical protein